MPKVLNDFLMCFVPIAIAVDAVSLLPIFISITGHMDAAGRTRIIWQSVLTAAGVGVAFLLVGKALLLLMGIQPTDFQIAGGLILLGLALPDILGRPLIRRDAAGLTAGVVPLGVPLIVGPGVLTAGLLLCDRYNYPLTIAALLVNLLIVMAGFFLASRIVRVLGEAGTKALTKLMGLLLASYAVMLVRDGIQHVVAQMK
jgi:multiple antibiotic resistance protein